MFFEEVAVIPELDSLVEGTRDNEFLGGMELGTHDKICVAGHNCQLVSTQIIPNSDSLII